MLSSVSPQGGEGYMPCGDLFVVKKEALNFSASRMIDVLISEQTPL
jgi:hypothetical protein